MTGTYVRSGRGAQHKAHNIKHEELNHWFRIWGIIGERRKKNPILKLIPFFDKGPGPGRGR